MITDTDKGLKAIFAADREIAGRGVKVGIQADAGSDAEGTDILDIAIYNEFGTATIPARPFIRGSHDKHKREAERIMAHLAGKLGSGASVAEVLNTLGQWYETKVKAHANSGAFVPNAPATVARKGSSKPLVDTGTMIGAIRYEVI